MKARSRKAARPKPHLKTHLTVRNVPPAVAQALDEEKRRRGVSLNRTVIDLLRRGLGVGTPARRSNGLKQLAGTWTEEDHRQFENAITDAEQIDAELWR